MTTPDLRDLLIHEGVFSASDKEKIGVTLIAGEVARRADRLSQRFSVSFNGTPRYVVKVLPKAWSFSADDILKTISAYSRLKLIKIPKLIAHFTSDDGYCFVEEYLPTPVSLDTKVESGAISAHDAFILLRNVFSEIHDLGNKPSAQFFQSEKRAYLSSVRSLVREGMWGDLILTYIERAIDKHVDALREIWSSGDLIGRNFLQSNGAWYLVDFEYSRRTVFGFVEAYRNILYTPWARSYTLTDLYPSMGNFPLDVAAMLAIAHENLFQAEVLDDEAREITQRHLRQLFWNVLDPAIFPYLDRHLAAAEGEVGQKYKQVAELESAVEQLGRVKAEEISRLQAELIHWQRTVVPAKDAHIASIEQTLRNNEKNLSIKELHIRQLTLDVAAKKNQIAESQQEAAHLRSEIEKVVSEVRNMEQRARTMEANLQQEIARQKLRILEVETWGNEMWDLAKQRESTIKFQQRSIEELSGKERALVTQLAQSNAAYSQKVNEFINIKSTLSYSVGRILTLPFEYLFIGVMKLFDPVNRALGRFLWPRGSRRAMLVDAFVNLKQTIVTATYLLRMHGFSGFLDGVRRTWSAGENLGLHRNLQTPIPMPAPTIRKPVNVVRMAEPLRIEPADTGVSVVIPTLNEADNLIKLLPTLNNQQGFRKIETIVVDSGSTDDTVDLAREYGAKVVQIPPEEFSHSGSRNLGAEQATQEYLLFMTADALPTSETWLYQMFSFMKNKQVTAVSCTEVPRIDADLFSRVENWYHYGVILALDGTDRVSVVPPDRDPQKLRQNAQLSDVACLVDAGIFRKYKFRSEYAEDLDLGMRLLSDGYKLGLMSSVKVIHSHARPAYYHLKRGFIDKLVITQMLKEPLEPAHAEFDHFIRDIFFTWHCLQSMITSWHNGLPSPIGVDEFIRKISELNARLLTGKLPRDISFSGNMYIDPKFRTFVEVVHGRYYRDGINSQSDGNLLKGIMIFQSRAFDYLRATHDLLDQTIIDDFMLMSFQYFASLTGRYFAVWYLKMSPDKRRLLEPVKSELFDGTITWKDERQTVATGSRKIAS